MVGIFGSARFIIFFIVLNLSLLRVSIDAQTDERATMPPRGWNSYDSFSWSISEKEFLDSAVYVSDELSRFGYTYVVLDYLWYRKNVNGSGTDASGFDVIDQWGRPQPEPHRWPSSAGGRGLSEVARNVHGKNLRFGIHVMGGISKQAYDTNTLIMDPDTGGPYEEAGRQWRAQDIGLKEKPCPWMPTGFMSVNTTLGAGKAFLKSLYKQYYDWGVDFIKHDCVFGDDFNLGEISVVSEFLKSLDRPIIYSVSPGTSVTPKLAQEINGLVNMYRITGDSWDAWRDVSSHFDVARDMAAGNMIGANGLGGRSWPDLDMLPFGRLTDPDSNRGPYRRCKLTLDEQKTQMTLWSMTRSPLMFGGDVRDILDDDDTFNLITNPTLLTINSQGSNNKEFPFISTAPSVSTPKNEDTSTKSAFGLTSCKEPKAMGWSMQSFDERFGRICWKQSLIENPKKPFCLYNEKITPIPSRHKRRRQNNLYQGKLHVARDRTDLCLGASPKQKLTSSDYKRGLVSSCQADANQMWVLNKNGTLGNSYAGLCAVVSSVKADAGPAGVRSWIATGPGGEIYVALFNLSTKKTTITFKISDLAKALPGDMKLEGASCHGRELWSYDIVAAIKDSLSIEVAPHGTALFDLHCQQ